VALQIIRYFSNDRVIYSQSDAETPANSGFPFELAFDKIVENVGKELDIVESWWCDVECTFEDDDYPDTVFDNFAAFEKHLLTAKPGRLTGKHEKWKCHAGKRKECQDAECAKRGVDPR